MLAAIQKKRNWTVRRIAYYEHKCHFHGACTYPMSSQQACCCVHEHSLVRLTWGSARARIVDIVVAILMLRDLGLCHQALPGSWAVPCTFVTYSLLITCMHGHYTLMEVFDE